MINCHSNIVVSPETHQMIADLLRELNQKVKTITDDYASAVLNRVSDAVAELGGNVDVFRQQDIYSDVVDISTGYISDLIKDALQEDRYKEGFAEYVANLYEELSKE